MALTSPTTTATERLVGPRRGPQFQHPDYLPPIRDIEDRSNKCGPCPVVAGTVFLIGPGGRVRGFAAA